MKEFMRADPTVLVEEVIQEHSHSEGSGLVVWLMIMAVVAFFGFISYASNFVNPGKQIASAGEEYTLFVLTAGFFFAVVLPVVWWIWRDFVRKHESGSRIELFNRKIIWWDGVPPRLEHVLDIGELDKITFEAKGEDDEDVVLWKKSGDNAVIPGICVKHTRDWAKALISHFPHVELGKSAPLFKLWKNAEN